MTILRKFGEKRSNFFSLPHNFETKVLGYGIANCFAIFTNLSPQKMLSTIVSKNYHLFDDLTSSENHDIRIQCIFRGEKCRLTPPSQHIDLESGKVYGSIPKAIPYLPTDICLLFYLCMQNVTVGKRKISLNRTRTYVLRK